MYIIGDSLLGHIPFCSDLRFRVPRPHGKLQFRRSETRGFKSLSESSDSPIGA
jgi:hypothetical protein